MEVENMVHLDSIIVRIFASTLKTTKNTIVHIPGLLAALDIHQKRRRSLGAYELSLRAVNKQTVNGETEHNKKIKMASTRKPESFVWTDNEVKLLLQLTLNYNTCAFSKKKTLSERGLIQL